MHAAHSRAILAPMHEMMEVTMLRGSVITNNGTATTDKTLRNFNIADTAGRAVLPSFISFSMVVLQQLEYPPFGCGINTNMARHNNLHAQLIGSAAPPQLRPH